MKKLSVQLTFLLVISLFISCDEGDGNQQPLLGLPTTFEIISNSEDHVILTNLLQENGLDEVLNEGTFTVFAPVDAAFENIDTSNLTSDEITNLLLYHVIQGNATSGNLSNTYLDTQASVTIDERESNLSILVNVSDVTRLNQNAEIIAQDLEAINGTIHSIDQVLVIPKLSTFINIDPNFETLLTALSRDNQPDFLSILASNLENDPAPISLFAPSNDAFTTALGLLGLDSLDEIDTPTLTEILNLHLINNANLRAVDFTEDSIETLGGNLAFDTENNFIIDLNGRNIAFELQNVQTTNGVLHVLADVILPESDLQDPGDAPNLISFTLDNEGATAYFVSNITGDDSLSVLNENNSTWTLNVGTRYNIDVVNAETHPLELRNDANETLLGQAVEGSFANDPEVAFATEGSFFSFTLTQNLANEISSYFCSNHPSMNGAIQVN